MSRPALPKPYHKTSLGNVYLADSLAVMKAMDPGSVDLIMTSPPFGLTRKKEYGNAREQEYLDWFKPFAKGFHRVLKDSGSFVIDLGTLRPSMGMRRDGEGLSGRRTWPLSLSSGNRQTRPEGPGRLLPHSPPRSPVEWSRSSASRGGRRTHKSEECHRMRWSKPTTLNVTDTKAVTASHAQRLRKKTILNCCHLPIVHHTLTQSLSHSPRPSFQGILLPLHLTSINPTRS